MYGERSREGFWLDRTALALTGIFLLVLPFPHTVTLRLVALFVAAGIVASRATRQDWAALPLKWPWLIWLAVQLVSLATAVNLWYSLDAIKAQTVYGFVAFALFYFQCRKPGLAGRLAGLPLVALVVLAAGGIMEWMARGEAVGPTLAYDGVGAFTTYAITVMPLAVAAGLAKNARWGVRIALTIACLLALATAYLGANRMFWLALAVEIVTVAVLLPRRADGYRRTWLYGLGVPLLLFVIGVVFYRVLELRTGTRLDDFENVIATTIAHDPRWPLWAFCVAKITQHPLYGVGFGLHAFAMAYPQWPLHNRLLWHAHNVFLNYGIEMGLPGIGAFLLLVGALLRSIWATYRGTWDNDRRLAALVAVTIILGVLAKNMTDDFFYQDLALLFWSLMGGMLGYFSQAGMADAQTVSLPPRLRP